MPQLRAKRQRQLFDEAPAVPPSYDSHWMCKTAPPGADAVDTGAGQEDPQGGQR